MQDVIPVVTSLDAIYSESAVQEERARWDGLLSAFEAKYGSAAEWVARAPGRVNIIGDHIGPLQMHFIRDYCGFGCLPAALQPDVLFAGRSQPSTTSRSTIRLASTDGGRFPDEVIDFATADDLSFAKHSWGNYVRAALKGTLGAHEQHSPFTLDVLVTGNVPPGGGLSSSAAMVIASSLACLTALGKIDRVNRTEMTEIAIESERAVGVNSGGMDQTASVFGQRSALLHISFVPKLTSRAVPLPGELVFVIANSLVTSEKQLTAKRHYNLRVVEARAFTALLARRLGVKDLPSPMTPKALIDALPPAYGTTEPERLQKMLAEVEGFLGDQKGGTAWDSVLKQLDMSSLGEFERTIQQGIEIEAERLQLYKRAKHVFSEALAVHRVCELLDGSKKDTTLAEQLGQHLNASQQSLRDDCESSCDEIDELIVHALEAGSLGSRVTGAGWGGCTVHLVPAGNEARLIDHLRKTYYAARYPKLTESELSMACFATKPETGACMYRVGSKEP